MTNLKFLGLAGLFFFIFISPYSYSLEAQESPQKPADLVSEGEEQKGILSMPAPSPQESMGEGFKTYLVKEGDTLWSISVSQLRDPFLWPKLWGKNGRISNPDLIYPGLILSIPLELLKPVEKVADLPQETMEAPMESQAESVIIKEVKVEEKVEEVALQVPEEIFHEEAVSSKPAINPAILLSSGYILSAENLGSTVVGSLESKTLLSQGDLIYLKVKTKIQPEIGDRWAVYNRVKKVYHPKTDEYMGELVRVVGLLDVEGLHGQTISARVIQSFDAIFKGDEAGPFDIDLLGSEMESFPSGPLTGYIIEVKDQKFLNGQRDVVYLDMGKQHGISTGDRFNIIHEGDKSSLLSKKRDFQFPDYVVGQVEVIGTQDFTSTARVLQTSEAVFKGDRVETP